jgi:hypothetical protein
MEGAVDRLPRLAFIIPLLVLHLPFVSGVHWTLAGELRTVAINFALAVVWDYLWFVLNPAYTVHRFRRGQVWWFEVRWLWRFPLDYHTNIALSIALAGLAALAPETRKPLERHLWLLAGLAVLTGFVVAAAPSIAARTAACASPTTATSRPLIRRPPRRRSGPGAHPISRHSRGRTPSATRPDADGCRPAWPRPAPLVRR